MSVDRGGEIGGKEPLGYFLESTREVSNRVECVKLSRLLCISPSDIVHPYCPGEELVFICVFAIREELNDGGWCGASFHEDAAR